MEDLKFDLLSVSKEGAVKLVAGQSSMKTARI